MSYLKENLVYVYSWPDVTSSGFKGEPSRRWFDPNNGLQLLFIINCFYDSIGLQSAEVGKRLEHLINTQMPLEKMSEITVFKWLQVAYLRHADH